MKSLTIIGAVLAASQCMPEPSDPATTAGSTATAAAADAGAPDAALSADAGGAPVDAASTVARAIRSLKPGPPPFSVPTRTITWPQQRAKVLVPQGTSLKGDQDRAYVVLGDGHNFAYHVSPVGAVAQALPAADAAGVAFVEREDGARVWFAEGSWFFSGTFGGFDCWNDQAKAEHDRDEVEMMLASCKSITQEDAP